MAGQHQARPATMPRTEEAAALFFGSLHEALTYHREQRLIIKSGLSLKSASP